MLESIAKVPHRPRSSNEHMLRYLTVIRRQQLTQDVKTATSNVRWYNAKQQCVYAFRRSILRYALLGLLYMKCEDSHN